MMLSFPTVKLYISLIPSSCLNFSDFGVPIIILYFRRHGKLWARYSRLLGSESGVVQFRSFATNNSSTDSEQLLGNTIYNPPFEIIRVIQCLCHAYVGGDDIDDDDDPPLNI